MLSVTRLLCGTPTPGDLLRYGETAARREGLPGSQVHNKPVVVWNDICRCNLFCAHYYIASNEQAALLSLLPAIGILTSKYINDQEGTHE